MPEFDPQLVITNIHRRYSGVSGTVNALLPVQAKIHQIAFVGSHVPGYDVAKSAYPEHINHISILDVIRLCRRPHHSGQPRIWHVRRDNEMTLAIFVRDVLRYPIRIVFTSAAKHRHSFYPRWLISKMDAVISTTPEAAVFIPNNTVIQAHGINISRFNPPLDKLNYWQSSGLTGRYGIGIFGRIRPEKGTALFVDAMIKLLPEFPDFSAVVCGLCAPQHQLFQQALIQKVADANLGDRLRFLGEQPATAVPVWYQRVLIAVACPIYEPFGLTPLEAMASGCVVVATDTGCFKSVVREAETGYVVPVNDFTALCDRLRMCMQDPQHSVRMGQAGAAHVQSNYGIEREVYGIEQAYSVCLNPR